MRKRIFITCLTCFIAVSITACSYSVDDDNGETKKNKDIVTQSYESQSNDITKEVETETETENNADYSYYRLLDEEYQKFGRYVPKDNSVIADGYVFMADNNSDNPLKEDKTQYYNKPCLVIKEDGSSVDLRKLDVFDGYSNSLGSDLLYVNGYFYGVIQLEVAHFHFIKLDLEGNVITNIDTGMSFYDLKAVSANGDAILQRGNEYYILKHDSEEFVEMPKVKLAGEHGLSVEARIFNFMSMFYGSKIYVIASHPNGNLLMCYFDFDDLSWHEHEIPIKNNIKCNTCTALIGRYAFLASEYEYNGKDGVVYDMETNTVVDNIPFAAANMYLGGDSNIEMSDNRWREIRIASEGEYYEVVKKLAEENIKENDAKVFPISKTHYLYKDIYGLFIRSFEKGKDDEVVVALASKE